MNKGKRNPGIKLFSVLALANIVLGLSFYQYAYADGGGPCFDIEDTECRCSGEQCSDVVGVTDRCARGIWKVPSGGDTITIFTNVWNGHEFTNEPCGGAN